MRTFVVCLVAVLGVAFPAAAHKPIVIDGGPTSLEDALETESVDISQVAYHRRTAGNPEIWLTFEVTANTPLYLQMGVPKLGRLEDYRPAMALVGPGLPQVQLPFEIPEGYGAYVFPTDGEEPNEFYEPFTGTTSWQFPYKNLTLETAGRYYVAGYAPQGDDGKFWIAIGKRESFSFLDIVSLPVITVKVRLFHEVFPIGGIAMWFFIILLIIGGLSVARLFALPMPSA